MDDISVNVGKYEVYSSGCVTSVDNADILFRVIEGISIRIKFVRHGDSKQSVDVSINDEDELQIVLDNFNNPLGTELTEPIEIGVLHNRQLLLYIKVIGMKDSSNRTLFYTWLLGEEVNNG